MSPPPPPQTLLSGARECSPRGTENWLVITTENKKDAIRRWLLNTLFALQGPNVGDEAWETDNCGCCPCVLWGFVAGEVGKKQVLPV